MGLLGKLTAYGRIFRRVRNRQVPDQLRLLAKSPPMLLGVGAFETANFLASRVDDRMKALALVKTSSLIGCPF
jgi:hypothetical protein